MGDRAGQSMVQKTVVRVPIMVDQPLFNGLRPV